MYRLAVFRFVPDPNSNQLPIHTLHTALQQFSVYYSVSPRVFAPLLLMAAQDHHEHILLYKPKNKSDKPLDLQSSLQELHIFEKPRVSKANNCWAQFNFVSKDSTPDMNKNVYGQQVLHSYCNMLRNQKSKLVAKDFSIKFPVSDITERFLPAAGHFYLPRFMEQHTDNQKFVHKNREDSTIKWTTEHPKYSFKL